MPFPACGAFRCRQPMHFIVFPRRPIRWRFHRVSSGGHCDRGREEATDFKDASNHHAACHKAAIGDQISPSSGPPGTEFLDAETGRQKQSAKRANARRDQNPGSERSEIPAETPYLASYRKRAACGDWMVGATEVPEISINNNLHEGQGDNGPLKRNGYFEDHPHLYRPSSPLAGRLSDV